MVGPAVHAGDSKGSEAIGVARMDRRAQFEEVVAGARVLFAHEQMKSGAPCFVGVIDTRSVSEKKRDDLGVRARACVKQRRPAFVGVGRRGVGSGVQQQRAAWGRGALACVVQGGPAELASPFGIQSASEQASHEFWGSRLGRAHQGVDSPFVEGGWVGVGKKRELEAIGGTRARGAKHESGAIGIDFRRVGPHGQQLSQSLVPAQVSRGQKRRAPNLEARRNLGPLGA